MARHFLPLLAILFPLAALAADDPLELTPLGDTTLTNTETDPPNEAYGLRPTLRLMTGKENHRIAMIFEFKDQAARPCIGAVLRLTTDKSWPGQKSQLRVYRLVRPFSERYSSWIDSLHYDRWINSGGDFDPQPVCGRKLTKNDGGPDKTIDIDVTTLVQGWQAKQFFNCGLELILDDEETNIHVHSKDGPDASKRPKLLLYYAAQPPKNPEMVSLTSMKPLGNPVQVKTVITSTSLNKATVGRDYLSPMVAQRGIGPYTWKATGLPDGITLAPTGELSGKPTKAGQYSMTLTATGPDQQSATAKVALTIEAPAPPPDAKGGADPEKPKPKKPETED
jgi:hypothetical protein